MDLAHHLDRTITIEAPQDLVFQYFTANERWAAWWGPGSTIDARRGGRVYIRHPNGIEAGGEVLEVVRRNGSSSRYGFASGDPMPIGASRVEHHLERVGRGTRVRLHHDFAEATVRDHHVQGWRYQLSVFANVVLDHSTPTRRAASTLVLCMVGNRRRHANDGARGHRSAGRPHARPLQRRRRHRDLSRHIGAAHKFMPGLQWKERRGPPLPGTWSLVDWIAKGPDGQQRAAGTNVFVLERTRGSSR